MGWPKLKPVPSDWTPPAEENSKVYGKLLIRALKCESRAAAYREALKNVMRSGPGERVKIAKEALFGKSIDQRGRQMLKVVKAAVIAGHYLRNGTDKQFTGALAGLEVALERFDLRGATAMKWLKEKVK